MILRLLNGLAAVFGAAGGAQFPAFYQQYLQRLGGRLDQARLDVDRIRADAASLGRTLEDYIQELLSSGTAVARLAGAREQVRVAEARSLETAYEALSVAGPLERPLAFVQQIDPGLAEETLKVFVPAMPISPEGFVYAATGLILGLMLMAGGEGAGRRIKRRAQRGKKPSPYSEQADV